jgi:hypothetical protein
VKSRSYLQAFLVDKFFILCKKGSFFNELRYNAGSDGSQADTTPQGLRRSFDVLDKPLRLLAYSCRGPSLPLRGLASA